MKRDQRRDSRPPFRHFWWLLGPVVAAVVYVWSTWPPPQPRVGGLESPSQTVPEGEGQPPKVSVPRQVPPDRPPPAASLPATHQPAIPAKESDPTTNITASWQRIDDPSTDGWDTEVLSELASEVCGQIGAALVADDPLTTEQAAVWVAADFTCTALLPALETVYQDKEFQVERLQSPDLPDGTTHVGAAGLRDALNRWREQSLWDSAPTFSKKVVRVEQRERQCVTQHLLRLVGNSRRGRQQQDTVWSVRWSLEPSGNLRMESIDVESFEQARCLQSGTTFVDCTHDALANNSCYRDQLLRGWNHWLERGQDDRYFFILGTPGMAVGDFNNDGLDDLYLCQEAGLPNRLLRQDDDGRLTDISAAAGVDWLEKSRAALFADLNNDGCQDLVVVMMGGLTLAQGDGTGHFTVRDVLPNHDDGMSISAADYDQDGKLDLYVCQYSGSPARVSIAAEDTTFVLHDANNGAANHMFRNEIDGEQWRFRDTTVEVGLDINNRRWSFAAAWEDYDNDGDPDLYVANDYGRNNLFRNDLTDDGERHFTDVAATAGTEDSASGMSVSWADYDRDGSMDVYVSNMFSAAGSRIAFQDQFNPSASEQVRRRLQRFARGNTLLRNLASGAFQDVSESAGVTHGRWAWGSSFADINNDGWEDLIVANGYVTTEDTGDL